MPVAIVGHDPAEGETAFAFFVLRLRTAVDRDGLLEVLRFVAPLIPDADTFIDEFPDALDGELRIIGIPWVPPEAGHAAHAQRRLIERADAVGVEQAWFFQTGTSLPSEDDQDDDEDQDDRGADPPTGSERAVHSRPITADGETVVSLQRLDGSRASTDEMWIGEARGQISDLGGDTGTMLVEAEELEDLEDVPKYERGDDEDEQVVDAADWSHGPPPQVMAVRFPVDNYPAILDDLDSEDFGIAFKLAGSVTPGENTVLLGFHTLWLAPYGERYRNTAVTIDSKHHAGQLWVDRFEVPCSVAEQVHHLLWIVAMIDRVVPVLHARFAGATMEQKYGGLTDDAPEPFVLGGNPLIAVHAAGGEVAVDHWLANQTEWSNDELGQMLRELAVEVVSVVSDAEVAKPTATTGALEPVAVEPVAGDDDEADGDDDDDDDDDDEDHDDDDDDDDDDDGDESEGNEDEDRGRHITTYAGDVLRARALAGTLDARVPERLMAVLSHPEKYEHRRKAVVEILGALRYRAAVPHLIDILATTPITNALDSIGKEDFIAATAAALGAIGDPAAISALAKVVAAPGTHNDRPRPVAADALATCLAASPEPRSVDDAVLAALLTTIHERNDGELNAETHFAYGRLARQLAPHRRAEARRRLADVESARDDGTVMLARGAALVLASPAAPPPAPPPELRSLLREALTAIDHDHDSTVRNLRVALRVAEVVPEIVDPADVEWLTRFAEADVRDSAHVVLAKIGKPLPRARAFDATAASRVDDRELLARLDDPHIVGRAALISEAGDRRLVDARPAVVRACQEVIERARAGGASLLDQDARVLESGIRHLSRPPRGAALERDTVALFDRILRHSNYHVKWELMENPPLDRGLIGGMFHVLDEKWGWQAETAKAYLELFRDTPEYQAERQRVASVVPDEDDEETN